MLNSHKGFTLIEIMIALAIIGILAAIAMPVYSTWVNKAKTAEAKANLSDLSQKMKVFWTEHGQFTTRLDAIGFNPEGSQYYIYGFGADVAPPPTKIMGNTNCFATDNPTGRGCFSGQNIQPHWTNNSVTTAGVSVAAYAAQSTTTFKAAAAANLNGVLTDVWTTDSSDALVNPQMGL